jgi:hypothetical protein
MPVFLLKFDCHEDERAAQKQCGVEDGESIWVLAENTVQVALHFPEATAIDMRIDIERDHPAIDYVIE